MTPGASRARRDISFRFNFPVFHARCLPHMKASWLLNVLPRLLLTKSPPIPSNITSNIVSSPRIHKTPRISKYIYVQHARQSAEIAGRVGRGYCGGVQASWSQLWFESFRANPWYSVVRRDGVCACSDSNAQ